MAAVVLFAATADARQSATGLIAGILDPAVTESSLYLVTARVFDPGGHVASVQFWWTVKFNHPPVVNNPGNQSAIPEGVRRWRSSPRISTAMR